MPNQSITPMEQSIKEHWDAAGYDRQHSFVWKYGEAVVELLGPKKGEKILDLGCGTGHLTHLLAQSGATVVGLDRSLEMLEKARKDYPEIEFVQGNGQDFHAASQFDAVFSNAALHWMRPPEMVAARIAEALRPGGRLVCEFGGKGNLRGIKAAVETSMAELGISTEDIIDRYYPSIGEYASLLEGVGLEVQRAEIFDRPTRLEEVENGMRRWLEMFDSETLKRIPKDKHSMAFESVERQLRPTHWRDGAWYADYRRIRVVAVRE